MSEAKTPPILRHKRYETPSAFTPESLLRETRRQKGLANIAVPDICILDPDGDIVRHLVASKRAHRLTAWACYHTELYTFEHEGTIYGMVGCAVGAAFAVLIAEELFASGCRLLLSVTSAGQISPVKTPPYFIVIDRALRDERTSYHYVGRIRIQRSRQPPDQLAREALSVAGMPCQHRRQLDDRCAFPRNREAIAAASRAGILAVEMEAAALYAFATARSKSVLCFAHVTNQMGRIEGDFEKGSDDGAEEALNVIARIGRVWRQPTRPCTLIRFVGHIQGAALDIADADGIFGQRTGAAVFTGDEKIDRSLAIVVEGARKFELA